MPALKYVYVPLEVAAVPTTGKCIANMLQRADRAAMEGDVVAMLRIYQEMQETK